MDDAAELIRRCRLDAGLTQQQLAVRSGTTKTAISRLESGRTDPRVGTLRRLLVCMGHHLTLGAAPMVPGADAAQLDAVADLTPTQRLDHALASQAALTGLLGSARGR